MSGRAGEGAKGTRGRGDTRKRRGWLGRWTLAARRGLLVAFLVLVGCAAPATGGIVEGVVTDMQASSLTRVEQLTVRDQQGQVWEFRAAEDALGDEAKPLNASHLREHMTFGDQVTVVYHEADGILVAERVSHE